MKIVYALWVIFLFAFAARAEEPDAQEILGRTIEQLSHSEVLSYAFRHQGPGAYALTTGWAKIVIPLGNTRGRFTQARIDGRTGRGERVQVVVDGPDVYALDIENKTLWHGMRGRGGRGLYNPEHLAPVFLLRALSRARNQDQPAQWVGRQVLGQTPCDVVDYLSERMDLRVWISRDDALPRRIEAYSEALFGNGALIIALDDLETNALVEEGDFELELPEGFVRAEYRGRAAARWD